MYIELGLNEMIRINCFIHGLTTCSDVIRYDKKKGEIRGLACEKCFKKGNFKGKWKLDKLDKLNKQGGAHDK